ncbi:cellulase family glycosylhydrolase [Actinosynnema sp. NPDC023794]
MRYAPQFWTAVATAFKGYDGVVFDLFNDPYPEMPADGNKTLGWQCRRDRGTCSGLPYETAGMQDLVDAARTTGVTNVLMLGGLEWANDLRAWTAHMPADPLKPSPPPGNAYRFKAWTTQTCWDSQTLPLAARAPIALGEFGQDNWGFDYMQRLVAGADAHRLSYLARTGNPGAAAPPTPCSSRIGRALPSPVSARASRPTRSANDPHVTR